MSRLPIMGGRPVSRESGPARGRTTPVVLDLGGLRGLVTVRSVLGNIGVLVLPEQVAVAQANEMLDEAGRPKDERLAKGVERLVERLAAVVSKLSA